MNINSDMIRLFAITVLLLTITGFTACERTGSSESSDVTNVLRTEPSVADLMESLGIQSVTDPITPPDFTLRSIDGEEVSLSQHRGSVVMLGFWTTW